jgi:hypothetical protein
MFDDVSSALVEKIEQVVRLIRSKGVGVYFVTQSPADIPDSVLGQLGNRIQHALRAFTPHDQKAVKVAADTLRKNPAIDTQQVITELAVGEALISMLDAKGSPTVTERAWLMPPSSQIGPITEAQRAEVRKAGTAMYGHYDQAVDRESAYEKLSARTASKVGGTAQGPATPPTAGVPPVTAPGAPAQPQDSQLGGIVGGLSNILFGTTGPRGGHHDGLVDAAAKSAARSLGSSVSRAIIRGTLGSILGGASRGRR